jgi:hypothetical protein
VAELLAKGVKPHTTAETLIRPAYFLFPICFNFKWGFAGGSGATLRYNTQIIHITQNNTPSSNKTQHMKLHKQ